jgi:hypothetical protein
MGFRREISPGADCELRMPSIGVFFAFRIELKNFDLAEAVGTSEATIIRPE